MSTVLVVDIMDLVEDHGIQTIQAQESRCSNGLGGCPTLEQEIAQNLRGHDDNLGIWAELDISGHDPDRCLREQLLQVVELLVTEGLDGRCVEDASASLE